MSKRSAAPKITATPQTYVAGCTRTWSIASAEPDLAYTALEFPECPACPHHVTPDGGPDFCTLRLESALHPFAALAKFRLLL
ncbi:hypothetical protein FNU79_13845 [Deinococcus detaillensis]|uniref:Uncharacterized protein n=1 Tax=Deinococcus detaillensis TaxID=2592048 RepID=A0A553UQF3_9DEIO|nr:hypothetical protein [Deinococcus detaillensis]TSA82449.1 hypothetical protein FNU79_13845 [Deinococcus detaillensis]